MDDRFIANIVNAVRDIAINFHAAEQLRARIAHVLVPHLKRIAELESQLAAAWREAAEAQAREREALDMLDGIYSAYEDGVEFRISPEKENKIESALNAREAMTPAYMGRSALSAAIEQARREEREACAKLAEGFQENRDWVPGSLWGNIRAEVARAIRAESRKEDVIHRVDNLVLSIEGGRDV